MNQFPTRLPIEVAGEELVLLPDRAALWPARQTLIVSDLHLGKDQTMRSAGVPMVAGCLEHDLARLSALVDAESPARVLITGDLVHAPAGLTRDLIDRVAAWRDTVDAEVWLIPGNHDRKLARFADPWKLTVPDVPLFEGPLAFFHFPAEFEDAVTVCGHLHPVAMLRPGAPGRRFAGRGGAPIKLHAFHQTARTLVMPAFGSFIAGVPVRPGPADRVFGCAEDRVLEVTGHFTVQQP